MQLRADLTVRLVIGMIVLIAFFALTIYRPLRRMKRAEERSQAAAMKNAQPMSKPEKIAVTVLLVLAWATAAAAFVLMLNGTVEIPSNRQERYMIFTILGLILLPFSYASWWTGKVPQQRKFAAVLLFLYLCDDAMIFSQLLP